MGRIWTLNRSMLIITFVSFSSKKSIWTEDSGVLNPVNWTKSTSFDQRPRYFGNHSPHFFGNPTCASHILIPWLVHVHIQAVQTCGRRIRFDGPYLIGNEVYSSIQDLRSCCYLHVVRASHSHLLSIFAISKGLIKKIVWISQEISVHTRTRNEESTRDSAFKIWWSPLDFFLWPFHFYKNSTGIRWTYWHAPWITWVLKTIIFLLWNGLNEDSPKINSIMVEAHIITHLSEDQSLVFKSII